MSREKYLIMKGVAGLGNRLITLTAAIDYATKTNRKIFVDWSDGFCSLQVFSIVRSRPVC